MSKKATLLALAATALVLVGGAASDAQTARGKQAGKAGALRAAADYLGLTPKELRQQLRGRSLAQLAVAQGKSVEGLKAALIAPRKERLDRAVASGRISSERAQQLLARMQARVEKLVDRVWGARVAGDRARHGGLRAAADYLGLTPKELRQQLRGRSLAEVANSTPGKSAQGLKDALLARRSEQLQRRAAAGRITAERAQQAIARAEARIDKFLNRVWR